jgi:hypothetical protein
MPNKEYYLEQKGITSTESVLYAFVDVRLEKNDEWEIIFMD